jgi:F-type H+-transporting ATPase subunit c
VARQPELAPMLMMRMFIMAGLLDAFAAISVAIGLMIYFSENNILKAAVAVIKASSV